MRSIRLLVLAGAALLFASSAGAGNLTVVSPGLGPETSASCPSGCKLSVNLTGDIVKAYLISQEPNAERTFRLGFWLNMASMNLPDARPIRFLEGRKDAPGGKILFYASVYFRNGNYKINFIGRNEDNSDRPAGGFDLSAATNQAFTFEWQAATGPATNDGITRVTKGNTTKGYTDGDHYIGGTGGVDQVRFGYVAAGDAAIADNFFLDRYESFRSLAP